LAAYAGTCVLVTHDRYFLDRIVTRIVEIEFGRLYSFPGAYSDFLDYKACVEDVRARTDANRRALMRNELAWLRRGARARTTKQKARIQRFEALEEQGPPPRNREFAFEIPAPTRLSKSILTARHVAHGYGDAVLFRDFNLIMQHGMRVGVIGENGCGKTTLLRVLMGTEAPHKGQVIVGDTTQYLYVDQNHAEVNPAQTVLQFVSDGQRYWDIAPRRIYVPAYLERFLFDKSSVDTPMGNLSGGERNRLDIARRLLRGGNFLVFDEPTNDLDLYTLRVLEEAVLDFDGCAIIVSHDRYFLNRVCTHLLVFETGGHIVHITGNYDDYLLYCERKRAEAASEQGDTKKSAQARDDAPGPRSPRLTYLEKKELDGIEDAIAAAEAERRRLEETLGDPAFYRRNPGDIRETLGALEAAKAHIDALYARWEELDARA
ncbi:MAG TPA: ATP-binding cassette domain-containing protein, partial [Candidatus Hydrogenedentes bacterium]|nr:ATP-binding cassette domain-containing protein [Candidatus Hydrogenedentota bacterium]